MKRKEILPNLNKHILSTSRRYSFKSMLFPEGAILNTETLEFGTSKISLLYRYVPNKKDLSVKEESLVVTSRGIWRYIFLACSKLAPPAGGCPCSSLSNPARFRADGAHHEKRPSIRMSAIRGDLTGIFLEHLFDDLFELRDRFKELGMFIEDGEVHLRDLEVKNDQL